MLKEIFEIINIFSASLPYYLQIRKFKETKNSEGFSLKVSLLILLSSILRIFFWFGKYFHWSLLCQSVLLIIIHLFLIFESVKFRNKRAISKYLIDNLSKFEGKIKNQSGDLLELVSVSDEELVKNEVYKNCHVLSKDSFFNWNHFIYYLVFLFGFTCLVSIICLLFGFGNLIFVESLGTIQTIVEGSMSVPQIFEIIRQKNVDNISIGLIASWFIGDFLKTYYFLVSNSPFQFLALGLTQCGLNIVIVFLYISYKKKK